MSEWKLLGIERQHSGMELQVLTPGGSVRRIPLAVRDLVLLIEHAGTVLRQEMEAAERTGRPGRNRFGVSE